MVLRFLGLDSVIVKEMLLEGNKRKIHFRVNLYQVDFSSEKCVLAPVKVPFVVYYRQGGQLAATFPARI